MLKENEFLCELDADLVSFEQRLTQLLTVLGQDFSALQADHISLRCHNLATAERWKKGLMQYGRLLSENMINGRPIYLFDLPKPLSVKGWHIDCVELPYPGEKHYSHEGWEHIELVYPVSPEDFHQQVLTLLPDEAALAAHVSFKFSHPKGERERLPNPTLAVSNGQTTIKFHPYSIRAIVASEQQNQSSK